MTVTAVSTTNAVRTGTCLRTGEALRKVTALRTRIVQRLLNVSKSIGAEDGDSCKTSTAVIKAVRTATCFKTA